MAGQSISGTTGHEVEEEVEEEGVGKRAVIAG